MKSVSSSIVVLTFFSCRFDVLQPSLFPMLLLLARLYPSTFDDGGDPSMSLKPFVPLVLRYGKVRGNLVRGNLDRRDYGKKQFVHSYINTKYCK